MSPSGSPSLSSMTSEKSSEKESHQRSPPPGPGLLQKREMFTSFLSKVCPTHCNRTLLPHTGAAGGRPQKEALTQRHHLHPIINLRGDARLTPGDPERDLAFWARVVGSSLAWRRQRLWHHLPPNTHTHTQLGPEGSGPAASLNCGQGRCE